MHTTAPACTRALHTKNVTTRQGPGTESAEFKTPGGGSVPTSRTRSLLSAVHRSITTEQESCLGAVPTGCVAGQVHTQCLVGPAPSCPGVSSFGLIIMDIVSGSSRDISLP